MKKRITITGWLVGCGLSLVGLPVTTMAAEEAFVPDTKLVERGRYIALVAGCNDCHTAGYAPSGGQVPESQWLTGDAFGWSGPWGTTYGTNLRRYMAGLTEAEWVADARTLRRRPPMPWFNLNAMEEGDLRAFYHYVRSLGEPGEPAPTSLPPGQQPAGPRAQWVLE